LGEGVGIVGVRIGGTKGKWEIGEKFTKVAREFHESVGKVRPSGRRNCKISSLIN
jgi:hypothetical protein